LLPVCYRIAAAPLPATACGKPYRYGIRGANDNSSPNFLGHPLFVQE
jgi:hypothetical protein